MRKKQVLKKVLVFMLSIGIVFGSSACNSNKNNSGDYERKDAADIKEENKVANNKTDSIKKTKVDEASKNKTQYPLTITTYDSNGIELQTVYEQIPKKVIAVYQGSVETMLALGLEDNLVATAGLDNEVPDEQKTAFSTINYLDEFTPSLETVTMLEPDMIFSWGSLFGEKTLGTTNDWINKNVNIYMNANTHPLQSGLSYNKTLDNEYNDILNIGKIFDVQDKAETIVSDMRDIVTKVEKKTVDIKENPTVLIIESSKDTFTNYGKSSLGGDMVTKLGGILANPDASRIGKEDVVAANPDVIFVVYMPYSGDNAEQVKQENLNVILKDDAYVSLDAVKNERVIPIMLSEMYASTTRTKDGIITFAKGLYPEIDLGLEK